MNYRLRGTTLGTEVYINPPNASRIRPKPAVPTQTVRSNPDRHLRFPIPTLSTPSSPTSDSEAPTKSTWILYRA
ncbi:hypothetical protein GJAV_G00005240 [Gymnothorax javanicus]|nr:hypothetical protein GJAV_G00005240 [Gymnothorax javanicus]